MSLEVPPDGDVRPPRAGRREICPPRFIEAEDEDAEVKTDTNPVTGNEILETNYACVPLDWTEGFPVERSTKVGKEDTLNLLKEEWQRPTEEEIPDKWKTEFGVD